MGELSHRAYINVVSLLVEQLDALFFRHLADEQRAVFLHHDVAVQSLDDHFLLLRGVDDAVVRIVEVDVFANAGVAIFVFGRLLVERNPRTKVAPSEGRRVDKDFLCLFHDGIVHGNVLAGGENFVNHLLLLLRVIVREEVGEDARHLGVVHTEGIDDGGHAPDEDAGVPEVVALLDVALGNVERGLLLERVYAVDVALARGGIAQVGLDVAVSCGREGGANAERHDGVGLSREVHGVGNGGAEFLDVSDDMVAGSHHYVGAWVALLDFPTDVADAGRSVALAGLEQHILRRHFRQLFADKVFVFCRGDYPNVLGEYDIFESLNGELDEGLATSQNVEKLLGAFGAAHRPKAAANAAGHNDEVVILHAEKMMEWGNLESCYFFFGSNGSHDVKTHHLVGGVRAYGDGLLEFSGKLFVAVKHSFHLAAFAWCDRVFGIIGYRTSAAGKSLMNDKRLVAGVGKLKCIGHGFAFGDFSEVVCDFFKLDNGLRHGCGEA